MYSRKSVGPRMQHPLLHLTESVEIETTTWSEFPNRRKAIVEEILISEEINKSKRVGP